MVNIPHASSPLLLDAVLAFGIPDSFAAGGVSCVQRICMWYFCPVNHKAHWVHYVNGQEQRRDWIEVSKSHEELPAWLLLQVSQYQFHGYRLSVFNMKHRCLNAFPTSLMPCLRVMKYGGRALFVCLASAHPADGHSRSPQRWQAAEKRKTSL